MKKHSIIKTAVRNIHKISQMTFDLQSQLDSVCHIDSSTTDPEHNTMLNKVGVFVSFGAKCISDASTHSN